MNLPAVLRSFPFITRAACAVRAHVSRVIAVVIAVAIAVAFAFAVAAPSVAFAHSGPAWWKERGVLVANKPADDFAAANIGQLKHIATQAAAELNAKLPGGAGADIKQRVAAWQQPPAAGTKRDDFAPLTLGQLKAVAEPFYARLQQEGRIPAGRFPWRLKGAHPTHLAVANIGQLKAVFSFVAHVPAAAEDANANGIPDAWEMRHFGNLSRTGNEQLTVGGLRIRDAFDNALDPNAINPTGSIANALNDGTPAIPATGATPLPATTPAVGDAYTEVFTYDSRNWLTAAKQHTSSTAAARAFTYDAEGNITSSK